MHFRRAVGRQIRRDLKCEHLVAGDRFNRLRRERGTIFPPPPPPLA